jgi:hypothetical protein
VTYGDLIGPAAALVLALVMLSLFYSGRILPRNTVPREDYEALRQINASYAEKFGQQTDALKALSAAVDKLVVLASKQVARR